MSSQIHMFHDCFDQVEDPRVQGRAVHPLSSTLLLIVAAVIADADGSEEIGCIGHEKLDWLMNFADFSAGIPSHDTITRVHSLIKPAQFQQALLDWHGHLCRMNSNADDTAKDKDDVPRHVAIDGKTARGSYSDTKNQMLFTSSPPGQPSTVSLLAKPKSTPRRMKSPRSASF